MIPEMNFLLDPDLPCRTVDGVVTEYVAAFGEKYTVKLLARLLPRIDFSGECWEWTGQLSNMNYGLFWAPFLREPSRTNSKRPPHLVMYELFVGAVPAGLELDHLCRNTLCVRPAHLEPVTHAENQRRMGAAQTHCRKAGHPYTSENTYRTPRGDRRCRACAKIRDKGRPRSRRTLERRAS